MGGKFERNRWRLSLVLDMAMVGALLLAAGAWWNGRKPAPSVTAPTSIGRVWPVAARSGHEGPMLALVFRSDCSVCAAQRPHWRVMARLADSLGIEVVAFTPEPIDSDIRSYFQGDPAIRVVSLTADVLRETRVTQVPTTVLIGADGVVRLQRVGVFQMGAAELAAAM